MALIRTRTINGSEDNALVLGEYSTSSIDNSVTRKLAFGSNWNVLRVGLSLAMADYPNQVYNRSCGLAVGLSSGSKTLCRNIGDQTCFVVTAGCVNNVLGFNSDEFTYVNNPVSGSFFSMVYVDIGAFSQGAMVDNNGNGFAGYGRIPSLGDGILKRGVLIYEFSSSATGYDVSLYSFPTTLNADLDITSDGLIAALTSSVYPPSASGVALIQRDFPVTVFDKTTYPLDTAFIDWVGGTPLEIYNWYIYKVN